MIVLDTNVVSELRLIRAGRGSAAVAAWNAAQPVELLFVSAVTLFELDLGIRQLERRDMVQGAALRGWFDGFALPAFEGRILAVSGDCARLAASFHVPDPAPFADSLIAATARVHGMSVATRDTSDFARFGVPLLNPWAHPLPAAGAGEIS